jgi:hypothetical protein
LSPLIGRRTALRFVPVERYEASTIVLFPVIIRLKGPETGNLLIGNSKLIEAITLTITIGNWHCSRIRVIGYVVDSISGPRKKTLRIKFYNDIRRLYPKNFWFGFWVRV